MVPDAKEGGAAFCVDRPSKVRADLSAGVTRQGRNGEELHALNPQTKDFVRGRYSWATQRVKQ